MSIGRLIAARPVFLLAGVLGQMGGPCAPPPPTPTPSPTPMPSPTPGPRVPCMADPTRCQSLIGGSTCESGMCFDELARQQAQIICFRATSRWQHTDLTYRVDNFLEGIEPGLQLDAFARAFAVWADSSALTFTRVEDGPADITLQFLLGDHDDLFPFDGSGGNLGHAFFPGSGDPGVVHLCADEQWVLNGASANEIDLFSVLVHEIGHALGVEHSLESNAVMWPAYTGPIEGLAPDDVDAIQKLYGSADGSVPPLDDPTPADFKTPVNLAIFDDPDADSDGIPDTIEVFVLNTDPVLADSDDDGSPDFLEVFVAGTDAVDPTSLPDSFTPECDSDAQCDDGIFCNGSESCLFGVCVADNAPCDARLCNETRDLCETCTTDAQCDDGLFCNGIESCVEGDCVAGEIPCPAPLCAEQFDGCHDCDKDQDCDDSLDCTVDTCGGPFSLRICVFDNICPTGFACDSMTGECEPALQCEQESDCLSCARNGLCGWCNDIDLCTAGCANGPTNGACAPPNWVFDPMQCP